MLLEMIKMSYLQARKSKDKISIALLSTLIGDIENVLKRSGSDQSVDAVTIGKIKSFIKLAEENVHNPDSEAEIKILSGFLPTQLTEEQILVIFNDNNLTEMKDRMMFLKENYAGLYDGKLAASLAKG